MSIDCALCASTRAPLLLWQGRRLREGPTDYRGRTYCRVIGTCRRRRSRERARKLARHRQCVPASCFRPRLPQPSSVPVVL